MVIYIQVLGMMMIYMVKENINLSVLGKNMMEIGDEIKNMGLEHIHGSKYISKKN